MNTYHITLDRIIVIEQAVRDAKAMAIKEREAVRDSAIDLWSFYSDKIHKLEDAEKVMDDMRKLQTNEELEIDLIEKPHKKNCGGVNCC